MAMESLEESKPQNDAFYSEGRAYLMALQKKGETDDGFEDEFYFTLPAISATV